MKVGGYGAWRYGYATWRYGYGGHGAMALAGAKGCQGVPGVTQGLAAATHH